MADSSVTPAVIDQATGRDWALWQGDCCEVVKGIPDVSVHFTIFSPPFISLYTYSDDPRDISNNNSDEVFWTHFGYLIDELYRAVMPGRNVAIHCMQLPTSKLRDGFIGLRDFRGDIIRGFQRAGFIYHSEICIRKDPVSAMMRTKAIGLLHKQVVKDSAISRMAIADYVVIMRKPGDNPEPVAGPLAVYHGDDMTDAEHSTMAGETFQADGRRTFGDHKSIMVWQRYAEPIWHDIAQSDVLSHKVARADEDERHISPLQLTVIRRCVQLWSNPGDVVLDPFAGIASTGHVALELGRRFIGVELKSSYYAQAVANMRAQEAALADDPFA